MQDLIGRDIPLTLNVDPMHVLTNDSQMVSVCVCILILILTLTLTHTHTHRLCGRTRACLRTASP
jgi:hypothetical protein